MNKRVQVRDDIPFLVLLVGALRLDGLRGGKGCASVSRHGEGRGVGWCGGGKNGVGSVRARSDSMRPRSSSVGWSRHTGDDKRTASTTTTKTTTTAWETSVDEEQAKRAETLSERTGRRRRRGATARGERWQGA